MAEIQFWIEPDGNVQPLELLPLVTPTPIPVDTPTEVLVPPTEAAPLIEPTPEPTLEPTLPPEPVETAAPVEPPPIEEVQETPYALSAVTDPARSDVMFGETHTSIEAIDETRTRIVYRTSIIPGFWVPAIGARGWMLRTLEEATVTLFKNVESRAQAREAGA